MMLSTPTQDRTALISRAVDFWLLGGASLFALAALAASRLSSFSVPHDPAWWILWAPYLRVLLEYPHLFMSYKLAYAPSRGLVRKHPWHLIVAPVVLIFMALFYLPVCIHLVLLGFGWHRVRQVWGCMLIYARYDNLKLDERQRGATNAFLQCLWVFGYLAMMRSDDSFNFFGVVVEGLIVPDAAMKAIAITLGVAWIYLVFELFVKTAYVYGRMPTLNFMMPSTSIIFTWVAFSFEPMFFFYLAPAFHALQYMNVAWAAESGTTWARRAMVAGVFIALGVALERLPNLIPALPNTTSMIAVAYAVLSLHHYILDSVIWRSSGEAWKRLVPSH